MVKDASMSESFKVVFHLGTPGDCHDPPVRLLSESPGFANAKDERIFDESYSMEGHLTSNVALKPRR